MDEGRPALLPILHITVLENGQMFAVHGGQGLGKGGTHPFAVQHGFLLLFFGPGLGSSGLPLLGFEYFIYLPHFCPEG